MKEIVIRALEEDGIIPKNLAKELLRKDKLVIPEFLISRGFLGDLSYCEWIKRRFGFEIFEGNLSDIDVSLVKLFPKRLIEDMMFIPVRADNEKLEIASPDPFEVSLRKISEICGIDRIEVKVCPFSLIKEVLTRFFSGDEDGGIEKFVDSVLEEALKQNATDIHIIPARSCGKIKFRIDGILRDFSTVSSLVFNLFTNRIKVISHLNVGEKRMPQDGRFSFKGYDVRVSIVPTTEGEKVALRILRREKKFSLEDLGLSESQVSILLSAIKKQSGFIFVAGPTGSGKTTTIYSLIEKIDRDSLNVFSVEDPVEYKIDKVNQIQVNEDIGLIFPKVLRHILRQDPDVIFVGEIRDSESADIAIKSALTGHLVFATLHSKDIASAIIRLVDLGIPENILLSALSVGISQRLVRLICQICGGVGCEKCDGRGFSGREGVFEVVEFSSYVKNQIRKLRSLTEEAIKEIFRECGYVLLEDEIKRKISQGKIREEELQIFGTF